MYMFVSDSSWRLWASCHRVRRVTNKHRHVMAVKILWYRDITGDVVTVYVRVWVCVRVYVYSYVLTDILLHPLKLLPLRLPVIPHLWPQPKTLPTLAACSLYCFNIPILIQCPAFVAVIGRRQPVTCFLTCRLIGRRQPVTVTCFLTCRLIGRFQSLHAADSWKCKLLPYDGHCA